MGYTFHAMLAVESAYFGREIVRISELKSIAGVSIFQNRVL
jgi:hypothetical protein